MQYSQQSYCYYPYYQPQVAYPVYYMPIQPYDQYEPYLQHTLGLSNNNHRTNIQQSHYDTEEFESEKSDRNQKIKIETKNETKKMIKKQKVQKKNAKFTEVLESTNLHKNFTKALISYAIREQYIIFKMLGEAKGQEFQELMHSIKNKLFNLSHIIQFTKNDEFLKAFRTLGFIFLKKESVPYIYNSKIQQKTSHLKHKTIIKKTLLKI